MTRSAILAGLALCAGLAACGSPAENAATARNASVKEAAVDVSGKAAKCIPASELGLNPGSHELKGSLRARLLTPQAQLANIRIFREDPQVTTYGQQTLYYTNEAANCVLWVEGISVQEFAQRTGMSPLGISPYYQPDVPKPATPAPTPTPSATPTAG